ncbi:MAG: IclR family transcriptional regulator [Rhodospirillales bacterium]|nr:MAG: IclR family transcriptional regulator [Rhodospirillales bacterium]
MPDLPCPSIQPIHSALTLPRQRSLFGGSVHSVIQFLRKPAIEPVLRCVARRCGKGSCETMKTVRSVERAISILFLVAQNDRPLGLSEISRSVGLDKATTLRLLTTLEGADLIQQDTATRRYFLGGAVNRLSGAWRNDLRQLSRPYLKTLWRDTNETVCLACPRGLERVYVEIMPSMHELSDVPAIGRAYPIHVGAAGIVLMAHLAEAEVENVLRQVDLASAAREAEVKRMRRAWNTARQQGYAFITGHPNVGSAAIAAPVFDRDGEVVAAAVVRGPEVRLTREKLVQLSPHVIETAARISEALGYQNTKFAVGG